MSFDAVQLNIVALEADFVGFFDVIEVWRSRQGADGPFEELTAATWRPARLPTTAGDPPSPAVTGANVNIVGKKLTFRFDEDSANELTITFTGTDPLTLAAVAGQIVTQGLGRLGSYVDAQGQLVVQTSEPGTGAVLRLLAGDGAAILNLPTEIVVFGKDGRIQLNVGTENYSFTDQSGSVSYYYKTRFRNTAADSTSDFSLAFLPVPATGLSSAAVACGQLDLVDISGKPLRNVEVRVHTEFNGILVESKLMTGGDVIKLSDESGHVEFVLARGQLVTVAVMGTDLVRTITVPTDPAVTVFNLLDPTIAGEDIFKVQIPNLIYAERRSL